MKVDDYGEHVEIWDMPAFGFGLLDPELVLRLPYKKFTTLQLAIRYQSKFPSSVELRVRQHRKLLPKDHELHKKAVEVLQMFNRTIE
jgi:hypothetical protein